MTKKAAFKYVDPYRLKRYSTASDQYCYPYSLSAYRIPDETRFKMTDLKEGWYILFRENKIMFIGFTNDLKISIGTLARKYYFDEIAFLAEDEIIPEGIVGMYKRFGGTENRIGKINLKQKWDIIMRNTSAFKLER